MDPLAMSAEDIRLAPSCPERSCSGVPGDDNPLARVGRLLLTPLAEPAEGRAPRGPAAEAALWEDVAS